MKQYSDKKADSALNNKLKKFDEISVESVEKSRERISIKIPSIIQAALQDEPIPGNFENSKFPKDFFQILATKKRKTENSIFYRVLSVKNQKELVLIVSPRLSIEIARNSLTELKNLAIYVQKGESEQITGGGEIYQEYELLHINFGWKLSEIQEQLAYDFLVALIMSIDKKASQEIRDYASCFLNSIIEFLCIPKNQIENLLNDCIRELKSGRLPFSPESGFLMRKKYIEGQEYSDTETKEKDIFQIRRSWEKKLFGKSLILGSGFLLLSFWIVSYQNHYWDILDNHKDMFSYNRKQRLRIISKYLQALLEKSYVNGLPPGFSFADVRDFLQIIQDNLSG